MKNPFIYCLYIHINKTNGKVYIGISINPELRWANGYGYKKHNTHFWAAIQKYGWNGFRHIIIRTGLSIDEAKELEIRWIYLFRANDPKFGYNKSIGGDPGNMGKNATTKEYINNRHREWQHNNTHYFRTYEAEHRNKRHEWYKDWYEKFKEEHGCTYITWKKRQLKNNQS